MEIEVKTEEERFNKRIARNLVSFRKLLNLTQTELAGKVGYSDKSISKWERAESVPDAFTLTKLAEFYGTNIANLTSERPILKVELIKKAASKTLFTILMGTSIWLIAVVVFTFLHIFGPNLPNKWMCFICAIPASALTCYCSGTMWRWRWVNVASLSFFMFGLALLFHMIFRDVNGIWLVYVVAGVSVVIIFCATFFRWIQTGISKIFKKGKK